MIRFLDIQKVSASYGPALREAVSAVVDSGRYLLGENTAAFEGDFARFCGAQHCVTVGNGLDALTLILLAYKQLEGWADGDEVIVPAFTFIASAEAVNRAGLKPVFCDVSPANFLLDTTLAAHCISPRTRAIMAVHLYGTPCEMKPLRELAARHGLKLIEDAAQAHGAAAGGVRTGGLGHAAGFSFYPGKNLGALGDAGAVVTDDATLATRVRMLANYGAPTKYCHELLGINSRMDELQAAVLRVKLRRLEADNARRAEIAALYRDLICHGSVRVPADGSFRNSVWHIFPVLTPHREALQAHLRARGVETLIHYPLPLHQQPAYAEACRGQSFPVAETVAAQELSLPISPVLALKEAESVANAINQFDPQRHTD